jgi:putative DNA primase/helicase
MSQINDNQPFKCAKFIARGSSTINAQKKFFQVKVLGSNAKYLDIVLPESVLDGKQDELYKALRNAGMNIITDKKVRNEVLTNLSRECENAINFSLNISESIGWQKNFQTFALPNKIIATKDIEKYSFFCNEALQTHNVYSESGTLAEWQKNVATPSKYSKRLMFGILCGFAPAIMGLNSKSFKNESFACHLSSTSSTGKTTFLEVGASIWGGANYIHSWNITKGAVEDLCLLHNCTTLCIDDIGKQGSDKKNKSSILKDIAFTLSDNKGRHTKLANNSNLNWQTIMLSTGEQCMHNPTLDAEQGSRVRMNDIKADAGCNLGIFEKLIDGSECLAGMCSMISNNAKKFYGTAGIEFVRRLQRNILFAGKKLEQFITRRCNEYIAKAGINKQNSQLLRVANNYALIYTAGCVAKRLKIIDWKEEEIFDAVNTVHLATLSLDNDQIIRERKEELRMFIADYYQRNAQYFSEKVFKEEFQGLILKNPKRNSEKEICFSKEIFLSVICKKYGDHQTLKYLEEFWLKSSEGKDLNNRTIFGKRQWLYCFKLEVLGA